MKTMYMHTLDGRPARIIRFTRGRVSMIPATPGVRLPLHPSLSAIRQEWSDCADDAFRQSKREFPFSPREVHGRAAADLINRLGYVLVQVPS